MTDRSGHRRGATDWELIARHDFGGTQELDATIVAALGEDGCWDRTPLYTAVDTERAEQFLASVDGDDARVVFTVAGHTVRVSADGTVEMQAANGRSRES
jgi:hypothetical protein